IAMALALEPRLIIADEPTTALDATVQAQILDLLLRLQQESDTALILITHDLGVVADIADDVMVMYAGRVAEQGTKHQIFYEPHHPYTKGLLESIPNSSVASDRLRPIPGQPPSLINLPAGCAFHPRCGYVLDRCVIEEPEPRHVGTEGGQISACWLPAAAAGVGGLPGRPATGGQPGQVLPGADRGVHPADRRPRAGGGRGVADDRSRHDARARRRDRIGQVHAGPVHRGPDPGHVGQGLLRWQGHHEPAAAADGTVPAGHPDDLPGPVRIAEPAPPGRRDHRRPVRRPQDRPGRRAQAQGPGPDGARRPQPRALY